MFDQYLICDDGFCNVISETGHIEGFELKIRIPYYRGVALSLVDNIVIKVNGETFTNDVIRFTVKSGSYMMSEMSTVGDRRWNFDESATLKVYKPGGLLYIDALIDLTISIRAPYGMFQGHCEKVLTLDKDKILAVKE